MYSKDPKFPKRIASKLLKEYADAIDSAVGDKNLASAKKYSLSPKLKTISIELLEKYYDYKKKDPTTKVFVQ